MSVISRLRRIPLVRRSIEWVNRHIRHRNHHRYFIEGSDWKRRMETVLRDPDNEYIVRVADAGQVRDDCLLMHNGIRVGSLSYYGDQNLELMKANRGVHEPQEERVFGEVLKFLPEKATMIELGSYWAFYSMWFHSQVKKPTCWMIEPDPERLEFGMRNFALNGMTGSFTKAFLSSESCVSEEGLRTTSVDDFVAENRIEFVDLLHSDIQGYELKMLNGARRLFEQKRLGYVFISTHSNRVHDQCRDFLRSYGFQILADANLYQSYSMDGLLVARAPWYPGAEPIKISNRMKDPSFK